MIFRSFKICNNWNSFHKDIESIKSNLIKNAYPPFLIDKTIEKYLDHKFSSNQNQLKDTSDVYYFKLPYIGNRIEEHIKKDNKSRIFKHLHSTTACFDSYNSLSFKIIDKANSKFDLKI